MRYIGWYSNKMRGQRQKRTAEEALAVGKAVEVIDVSEHQPRRIPSAKWRELIKRVWESDPLVCPRCAHPMRIVSLIDDPEVIERILRHLSLWEQGVRERLSLRDRTGVSLICTPAAKRAHYRPRPRSDGSESVLWPRS